MNAVKHCIRKPFVAAIAGAMAVTIPVSLAVPAQVAVAQSQASQLDRATRALRSITTMRADFTQTDRANNVVAGELTLKNPGKIRFEYSDDVNMLVVSNGRALTLIDYDVNQVERWPISNSPLGALLDPDRDMRRFGRIVESRSGAISIEVADPDRPEFGTIRLIFVENSAAPGGLQLTSWVALDAQNQRTTVRLRNHRYGMSVSDDEFRYRDPRRSTRRPG